MEIVSSISAPCENGDFVEEEADISIRPMMAKAGNNRRYSVIELSEKVCDSAVRVRSTLAHELCHAACWIIFSEGRDNHGPLWRAVTRRVNRIHPELPKVTEHHSYTIHYKYNYKSSLCDKEIGRFQKIADNKCYCHRCGGRLHQLSVS
ncbi:germ cell nuclear acidic protein-like isoform X1 [Ranitomeya imitator]|uniref:germ cell nuclear acidic protein-like isoform X1 n=1 Tax=Ranitomeya imitator TaxID=111125 RepID=UPI0037E7BCD0